MPHLVFKFLVRQHVTKPGFLPQVERLAHLFTWPRQLRFTSVASTCCAAQLTYAPWLVEAAQLQWAATAVRALAMSDLSGSAVGSHLAETEGAAPRTSQMASSTRVNRTNPMEYLPGGH
jgi:hypothetical protein